MDIKTAIEKAIDGGYKYHGSNVTSWQMCSLNMCEVLLDPLFWQSLGKALGWGEEMVCIDEPGHPKEWCYYFHCPVCGEIVQGDRQECPNECETNDYPPIESWKYRWHCFVDALSEGKSADDFFKEL